MKHLEVLIERDERLSIPKVVPAWVVPVLGIIHSPEKVNVVRELDVEREAPNAELEFDRLEKCYGGPPNGAPWVTEIYGQPPRGVRELQRAIDEACEPVQSDDPTA